MYTVVTRSRSIDTYGRVCMVYRISMVEYIIIEREGYRDCSYVVTVWSVCKRRANNLHKTHDIALCSDEYACLCAC